MAHHVVVVHAGQEVHVGRPRQVDRAASGGDGRWVTTGRDLVHVDGQRGAFGGVAVLVAEQSRDVLGAPARGEGERRLVGDVLPGLAGVGGGDAHLGHIVGRLHLQLHCPGGGLRRAASHGDAPARPVLGARECGGTGGWALRLLFFGGWARWGRVPRATADEGHGENPPFPVLLHDNSETTREDVSRSTETGPEIMMGFSRTDPN